MKDTSPAELLQRGVDEVIDAEHLSRQLRRKQIRVKLGIDPTGYQLHLGHAVPLRRLRAFQDAGHQAVLIIGDFTAQIGDPTGRDKTRPALSPEQTKKFAADYLDQAGKILDRRTLEVRYNSEWFSRMDSPEIIQLMSRFTVNQILAHETFGARLKRGEPLSLHEMLYPILQGYDSVMVNADLELGGMDQKFNLLIGREVQRAFNQDPQDVMLCSYLLGTDGKIKMGKTAGNYIALDDPAEEMYGKIMSIPDKRIVEYFELASNFTEAEIVEVKTQLKKKTVNPKDVKAALARRIVEMYHGEQDALYAETHFDTVHRKKTAPAEMSTMTIRGQSHNILDLLVSQKLAASRSEGRRLIEQGGVRIDQKVVTDWQQPIRIPNNAVLQVGKRRFIRITIS